MYIGAKSFSIFVARRVNVFCIILTVNIRHFPILQAPIRLIAALRLQYKSLYIKIIQRSHLWPCYILDGYRWFVTENILVQPQARFCGISVGQIGVGADFFANKSLFSYQCCSSSCHVYQKDKWMRLRNLQIKQTYSGGVEHLKERQTRCNFYNLKMFKPVCSNKSLLGIEVGGL
jgi:hypothetical protein